MSIPTGGIWLDARGTQSAGHGERGIARFVAEHTSALVSLAPDLIGAVGIDPDRPLPGSLQHLSSSGKLKPHGAELPPGVPRPSIYHVMSPFEDSMQLDDVWPAWARSDDCRLVVTLHDLIPLVLGDLYLSEAGWGSWGTVWKARLGLIRSAEQIVTNSRHTADDALEHLAIPEERITVIESGVPGGLASLIGSRAEAERLVEQSFGKLRPGFLLYVGGVDPRKNMLGTILAYALLPERLRAEHQLVIACRLDLGARIGLGKFAWSLGIKRRDLLLTGYVPDRTLAALYKSCELFVFPSLYEGAGLPILEAMSCGAPVAAGDNSSIPELLGDLDATFDASDPEDVARCLREALEDPAQLEALRERSARRAPMFTWKRVAERTLPAYERALEAEPRVSFSRN